MTRLSDFKTYPEFVDQDPERGYKVIDIKMTQRRTKSQGATDRVERVMAIPLTAEGEYIGRHEMGHAKWSPKEKPSCNTKLLHGCMEACEEYRVNTGLMLLNMRVDYPDRETQTEVANMEEDLLDGQLVKSVLRLVVSQGTNAGPVMRSVMRGWADKGDDNATWICGLMDRLDLRMKLGRLLRPVPSFKKLFATAKWLEKQLRKQTKSGDQPDNQAKKVMMAICVRWGERVKERRVTNLSYKPWDGGMGWWGGRQGENTYDQTLSPYYGMDWSGTSPGDMTVLTPKLTVNIIPPELEKTMRARAADEGTEFRYIERFVSDQRVFKRRAKKRKGGGSVLVDTSSSMGLTDNCVSKIVKGSPEATKVATYSGDGDEGWLKVVVDKGKMLNTEHDTFQTNGGSNVIDMPALEWLSMQPEPRVWISDGCVTGCQDHCNPAINKACNTIMGENRIVRVENVDEACKALKRMDGVGYHASEDYSEDDDDDDEDEEEEEY